MNEQIEQAREELKRIDHLIYVTLKYTRTVDVLISIVDRMINAYEFAIDAVLYHAKERGDIAEMPENPVAKSQKLGELLQGDLVKQNIDEFILFRKIKKINTYERSNEYRRHVCMRTTIDNKDIEINIDNITEKYHELKKFVDFVMQHVEGKEK
jgi:hypothetical protein